jgi:ADP-ribose pyrophosphatase YjhB (NUDIX family)
MSYIEELRALVGTRQLITVGVGVVVLRGEEVLLELRRDGQQWGLPGGFKELGETLEDAARRELLEETGLTARTLRFLTLCSGPEFGYTYPNGDRIEHVAALYRAVEVEGEMRTDPAENLEVGYFSVYELPSPMQPLSERLLARAFRVIES